MILRKDTSTGKLLFETSSGIIRTALSCSASFKDKGETIYITDINNLTQEVPFTAINQIFVDDQEQSFSTLQDVLQLMNSSLLNPSSELGWVYFGDSTYTSSSPQSFAADTRTKLLITKDTIVSDQAPEGALSWWNGSKFTPSFLGDTYLIRLNFTANPTLNNRNVFADFTIDNVDFPVWKQSDRLARGATNDSFFSFEIPVFVGSNFLTNGAEFFIEFDGVVDVYALSLFIRKTYHGK